MIKVLSKRIALIFVIVALGVGGTSCAGGKSTVNTTWSLVKLVSVGDPIENSATELVEVKNCGIPIETTTDCSAGTSNDLNVSLTSGGTFGTGAQFVIEGTVGTTLGIGQQSGQSVKLPNPPDGSIYTYTVSKSYKIVTGQLLAHSSNGDEQVANFNFHASCSIDIIKFEQTSCSGNSLAPNTQLVPQPTIAQAPTQNGGLIHDELVSPETLARIVGGDDAYWAQAGSVVWVYSNKNHNTTIRHPGENMVLTYWAGFGDPQNANDCQIITSPVNSLEKAVKCPSGTNAQIVADQVGLHLVDYTGFFP